MLNGRDGQDGAGFELQARTGPGVGMGGIELTRIGGTVLYGYR